MASEARLPFGDSAITLDFWVTGGFARGFLQRVLQPAALDVLDEPVLLGGVALACTPASWD